MRRHAVAAPDHEVPVALRAAEYTLLYRVPAADDLDTKRGLIELASVSIEDATEDWDLIEFDLMGRSGQAHALAALWLRDLALAELHVAMARNDKATVARSLLRPLHRRLDEVLTTAKDAHEFDLLEKVERRYESNDLVKILPVSEPESPFVVVTPDNDVDVVPRVVGEYMQAHKIGYHHIVLARLRELRRVLAISRRRTVCWRSRLTARKMLEPLCGHSSTRHMDPPVRQS